eukprot:ANDGO_05516.mRNA.1 hypothetical protein
MSHSDASMYEAQRCRYYVILYTFFDHLDNCDEEMKCEFYKWASEELLSIAEHVRKTSRSTDDSILSHRCVVLCANALSILACVRVRHDDQTWLAAGLEAGRYFDITIANGNSRRLYALLQKGRAMLRIARAADGSHGCFESISDFLDFSTAAFAEAEKSDIIQCIAQNIHWNSLFHAWIESSLWVLKMDKPSPDMYFARLEELKDWASKLAEFRSSSGDFCHIFYASLVLQTVEVFQKIRFRRVSYQDGVKELVNSRISTIAEPLVELERQYGDLLVDTQFLLTVDLSLRARLPLRY